MWFSGVILMMCALRTATHLAPGYTFRESYPLEERGMPVRAIATLDVAGYAFKPGDRIVFDIRVHNHGGDGFVYNPFFAPLYPPPAGVMVYDADKRYIGKYPPNGMGSQAPVSELAWVYLHGGGYVGATLWGRAGHVPGTASEASNKPLPPGRYHLQAVFYNAFIGKDSRTPRMVGPKDRDALRAHYDTKELFRSNLVEIELTSR
jgi:hypothetical protein